MCVRMLARSISNIRQLVRSFARSFICNSNGGIFNICKINSIRFVTFSRDVFFDFFFSLSLSSRLSLQTIEGENMLCAVCSVCVLLCNYTESMFTIFIWVVTIASSIYLYIDVLICVYFCCRIVGWFFPVLLLTRSLCVCASISAFHHPDDF